MTNEWCGWPVVDEATGWETAQQILTDAELSDGLPLVPPIRRRLEAMVAAIADRSSEHGLMPPMFGELTPESVAYQCVIAGCLPAELPFAAIGVLCAAAKAEGVTIEVQVFGRQSLALSARCYHARAHGRTKDTCRFICENDPDGLPLTTLDDQPFLVINGIQTLSLEYVNLVQEIAALKAVGVSRFRLSPHSCDMVRVCSTFRQLLDEEMAPSEALARLEALQLGAPFANGFLHGQPGHRWTAGANLI